MIAANASGVTRRLARLFVYFLVWLAIAAVPLYVILYRKGWHTFYPCAFFVVAALYWLRAKVRVYYGLTELMFGLVVFYTSVERGRGAFSNDFSADFQIFNLTLVGVTAFSAAYIMIRGLENMETGLRIEGCDLKITKR